ncbi:GSCOCG00012198001-RA-CDS, partial [Cotesia congregata]
MEKTRVPPKINYHETSNLDITSEDTEKTQETGNEEQGDDEVFLPASIPGPSTNPIPDIGQEGDDEAEKEDEAEKDNETTVPQKQRRKTCELVKMFDELLQRRPPSENTYRERALEKIRREEAIFNYTPQEYAEIKRTSSETTKNIRQSLSKLPPLWRTEDDSLNEDTAPEINVDEFLRDNSDQPEEGSSDISPEETGGIEDLSEAEHPIIIELRPSTSADDINIRNVIDTDDEENESDKNTLTPRNVNRSRFTGYLGDGPKPRTPIFGRVLITDELAAMGIRYDHASRQIVDENGKGINETAETESADPNN